MTASQIPILIVGAGVTGLTLGCVLKRAGASVRIIDKLTERLPFARAVSIRSRTLEAFQDLGLVDVMVENGNKGGRSKPVRGWGAHCPRARHRYRLAVSLHPGHRTMEDRACALEDRLADFGAVVERRTELLTIEERLDGVRLTLRLPDGSKEVCDASWLIGCDGAHSAVRHHNRRHFPGEQDPSQYIEADVVLDPPPVRDETWMFLSDEGMLSWVPLPEGRTLVNSDVPEHHDAATEKPTFEEFKALFDARGPAGIEVRDPRWLTWYRVNFRVTPHYRHGRTFLVGDAAHVQSPFSGQGLNTGIQDAYNLGWKLALVSLGHAPQSLLDSYEKERHSVAEDVLALGKKLTEYRTAYKRLPQRERDRLYRHLHVPDSERRKAARRVHALDLDYRRSPICSSHIGHSAIDRDAGPHAGSEALDAGPLHVSDRAISLFELISGPRHTLLLFLGPGRADRIDDELVELGNEVSRVYGDLVQVCIVLPRDDDGREVTNSSITIVRDPEGALGERYAATEFRLYLIRPDGYVGWRADRPSLGALREYLAKVFTSRRP